MVWNGLSICSRVAWLPRGGIADYWQNSTNAQDVSHPRGRNLAIWRTTPKLLPPTGLDFSSFGRFILSAWKRPTTTPWHSTNEPIPFISSLPLRQAIEQPGCAGKFASKQLARKRRIQRAFGSWWKWRWQWSHGACKTRLVYFECWPRKTCRKPCFLFCRNPPDGLSGEDTLVAVCYAASVGDAVVMNSEQSQLLDEAIQANQSDARIAQVAGDYYLMKGRYEEATESYLASFEIDGNNPQVCNNLALAFAEQTDGLSKARTWLEKAEELDAGNPQWADTRAVLETISGDTKEALATLDRSSEELAEDPVASLHRAAALRDLGEATAARQQFLEALCLGIENAPLTPRDRSTLASFLRQTRSQPEQTARVVAQGVQR